MNGLAICAGAAGLELGLRLLFGRSYRTVGYVERDAYAAAALVARMADASLDQAPVWDDLKTFDGRAWRGCVDIVTAGFPCQPVSSVGKRKGVNDERWLWPEVWTIVREVRPASFFCENVVGLLSANGGRAFATILRDVANCREYDMAWDAFTAASCGAPHVRKRLFLLGVAHAGRARLEESIQSAWRALEAQTATGMDDRSERHGASVDARTPFPPGPGDIPRWREYVRRCAGVKPAVRRGADGMADRVDRLRLAGNGVVPVVAARAFVSLARTLERRVLGCADHTQISL